MDTPRAEAEVRRAWEALDQLYARHPTDPLVAGARAAAEWTLAADLMPVRTPVTRQRAAATLDRARDESHRSAMVELGILAGDVERARGVSAWMFWWIGLRPLPPWLRRLTAVA